MEDFVMVLCNGARSTVGRTTTVTVLLCADAEAVDDDCNDSDAEDDADTEDDTEDKEARVEEGAEGDVDKERDGLLCATIEEREEDAADEAGETKSDASAAIT